MFLFLCSLKCFRKLLNQLSDIVQVEENFCHEFFNVKSTNNDNETKNQTKLSTSQSTSTIASSSSNKTSDQTKNDL
jgi:hypothetical protein